MDLTDRLRMSHIADMTFHPMSSPEKGCFLGHLLRLHLSSSPVRSLFFGLCLRYHTGFQ